MQRKAVVVYLFRSRSLQSPFVTNSYFKLRYRLLLVRLRFETPPDRCSLLNHHCFARTTEDEPSVSSRRHLSSPDYVEKDSDGVGG